MYSSYGPTIKRHINYHLLSLDMYFYLIHSKIEAHWSWFVTADFLKCVLIDMLMTNTCIWEQYEHSMFRKLQVLKFCYFMRSVSQSAHCWARCFEPVKPCVALEVYSRSWIPVKPVSCVPWGQHTYDSAAHWSAELFCIHVIYFTSE